MEVILAALAAGAAGGLTGVASQAVKDAYGALKVALLQPYAGRERGPDNLVRELEQRPADRPTQESLAEFLRAADAARDVELVRLSAAVLDAVERDAPQAAARAGVDLRRVRAQFLHVQDVEGGVSVQDAEMTGGGITISSVRGTGGPDPNR